MAELKPCPFCGYEKVRIIKHNLDCGTIYQGYCLKCGTLGPDYGNTEQQAIDAWNKRSK